MRPRGRGVHKRSLGFTPIPLGSSGSLGFLWVRLGAPRGRRVHSGSRGITPVRVGFIQVRVVSLLRT